MTMLKSMSLFVLAGLCEIGGDYLIWRWFKEDRYRDNISFNQLIISKYITNKIIEIPHLQKSSLIYLAFN